MRECLAFDDVLCVPRYSDVRSRMDPDTSVKVAGIDLKIPMIASPMDTVCEAEMAIELAKLGGMGILHRFCSVEEQVAMAKAVIETSQKEGIKIPLAMAVGVTESEKERFSVLSKLPLDLVVIDVANGYHTLTAEMLSYIREISPDISIMAGNVADREGFKCLAQMGVDAVRVGIGSGSICSTRIQTGFGVPLLSSILDCAAIKSFHPKTALIADGGIRYPADVVKSLVAGADAVICGSIFAGTKEAPGGIIYTNDGKAWKNYRGMASFATQLDKKGGLKVGTTAEGVSQLTEYKGSLERVINDFVGGLRSGMSYAGAWEISDLRDVEFVRITGAGLTESHAHGTRR